jgi:ABC-type antimicrobial peptide transport system permease subunit
MIHVLAWFLCDYMMLKLVQNGKLPFSKFDYVLAWIYRETICIYLFLKAASDNTVKWRDGKYRLKWGGLAEEIVENKYDTKSPTKSNSNLVDEKSNQFINVSSSSLATTNGKKVFSHKRNSSYSVLMNNNNNNNNLINNVQSNTTENFKLLTEPKNQIRAHHQHHHSISTPISVQTYPQLLVQTTNETDFKDIKLV